MKLVKRVLIWGVALLLCYIGGLLLYGTVMDWVPKDTAPAQVWPGTEPLPAFNDSVVRIVTWNLGYGGIGNEDFFFYNKGDFFWTDPGGVRMTRERIEANVTGQAVFTENTLADFFLFQEVDTAARRSHDVNMLDRLRRARPEMSTTFAPNFKSNRVPIPIFQPWDHYGYVTGGLVSSSTYRSDSSTRLQLPGEFPWPTKLFQLDRCALRQQFPTGKAGKFLVVYNVHLSAYDKGGGMRRQQIDFLRAAALADYRAGHYVIVGGDWNQLPPGFNWFTLNPTVEETEALPAVPFDYMPPGWKYAYDPGVATVRASDLPYDSHRSRRSLIDFYLISPNLRIQRVKGFEMGFMHSDHQPVYAEFRLL